MHGRQAQRVFRPWAGPVSSQSVLPEIQSRCGRSFRFLVGLRHAKENFAARSGLHDLESLLASGVDANEKREHRVDRQHATE